MMNRWVVSWSASQSRPSSAPSLAYQESVSFSLMLVLSGLLFDTTCSLCWATQSNNKTFILSSVREVVSLEKWRCRKALCVSMCACSDQQKQKIQNHTGEWTSLKSPRGSQQNVRRLAVHSSLPAEEKPSNMHEGYNVWEWLWMMQQNPQN